jgi:hypothetical protein
MNYDRKFVIYISKVLPADKDEVLIGFVHGQEEVLTLKCSTFWMMIWAHNWVVCGNLPDEENQKQFGL